MHTLAIANVNYIEWMMGYPKDWTKVRKFKRSTGKQQSNQREDPGDEDDGVQTQTPPLPVVVNTSSTRPKVRYNGMHMLMKDMPGKDIKEVAAAWRNLSPESKSSYTQRAVAFQTE
jgi:electron transfer flavoprotein alpha/beta subunit